MSSIEIVVTQTDSIHSSPTNVTLADTTDQCHPKRSANRSRLYHKGHVVF